MCLRRASLQSPATSLICRKMDRLILFFFIPSVYFPLFVVLHIKKNHLGLITFILFYWDLRRERNPFLLPLTNGLPFADHTWGGGLGLLADLPVSTLPLAPSQDLADVDMVQLKRLKDSSLLFFLLFFKWR